jgi:hypothetical protein
MAFSLAGLLEDFVALSFDLKGVKALFDIREQGL